MEKRNITLTPTVEATPSVQQGMDEMIEELDIPLKCAVKLHVILDEIYSNIARYSEAGDVKIELMKDGDDVTLQFSDNGTPFDPTMKAAPDTSLTAEERAIGGLGIHMVRNMSKEMRYHRNGEWNILSIVLDIVDKK